MQEVPFEFQVDTFENYDGDLFSLNNSGLDFEHTQLDQYNFDGVPGLPEVPALSPDTSLKVNTHIYYLYSTIPTKSISIHGLTDLRIILMIPPNLWESLLLVTMCMTRSLPSFDLGKAMLAFQNKHEVS